MAKYRLLSAEELKELEPDFIKYLVVNGITADDWKKLKVETPEKANNIVDLFSDVVFEKILRSAKFIKQKTAFALKCVKCNSEEMILFALNSEKENDFENATMFKGVKKYNENRELAIFKMLQNGFEITKGEEFEKLKVISEKGDKINL